MIVHNVMVDGVPKTDIPACCGYYNYSINMASGMYRGILIRASVLNRNASSEPLNSFILLSILWAISMPLVQVSFLWSPANKHFCILKFHSWVWTWSDHARLHLEITEFTLDNRLATKIKTDNRLTQLLTSTIAIMRSFGSERASSTSMMYLGDFSFGNLG